MQSSQTNSHPRDVTTHYELHTPKSHARPADPPVLEQTSHDEDPLVELMKLSSSITPTERQAKTIDEEIGIYLSCCETGKHVPEIFWQENESRFPKLSAIAKRIMAIIPSSASTERQFPCSKRIQGLRRVHLADEVFEDQVLITSNPSLLEQVFDELRNAE